MRLPGFKGKCSNSESLDCLLATQWPDLIGNERLRYSRWWLGKWNHPISQVHCKTVPFSLTYTNPRKNARIIARCGQHLKQTHTAMDFVTPVLHLLSGQTYPLHNRKLTGSSIMFKKGLLYQTALSIKDQLNTQPVEAPATMASSHRNLQIRMQLEAVKARCGSEDSKWKSSGYLYSWYLTEWQHWCEAKNPAPKHCVCNPLILWLPLKPAALDLTV